MGPQIIAFESHSELQSLIQWSVQMRDTGDYPIDREQREVGIGRVNS